MLLVTARRTAAVQRVPPTLIPATSRGGNTVMKASTLTTENDTDHHFLARMEQASTEERDAIFADLARRARAGDELAARTIRVLVLPTCRRIGSGKGDGVVAALVDAAYQEILDWRVAEERVTR